MRLLLPPRDFVNRQGRFRDFDPPTWKPGEMSVDCLDDQLSLHSFQVSNSRENKPPLPLEDGYSVCARDLT
jgi:hypothetical protein